MDNIKAGDRFERRSGTIITVKSVFCLWVVTDNGDFHERLFNDGTFKKIEEPKYIEHTEKVKWAMNNMRREKICKDLADSLAGSIEQGEYCADINGEDAEFLIKELSAPEKFDPIEHMKNGGFVNNRHGNIFKMVRHPGSNELSISMFDYVGAEGQKSPEYIFNEALLAGELKPYVEPEPTQEEVVKKGWAILCRLNDDDLNEEDKKAVDAAIEHFEKLVTE